MSEPIKLYFDKVENEGKTAVTTNGEKILYNLKLIGNNWFEAYTTLLAKENMATMFLPAGRYICIISASLDLNAKSMNIMDLMNREDAATFFAAQSEGNDDIFMGAWRLIKYKEDYNKFKLVAAALPPQDIDE